MSGAAVIEIEHLSRRFGRLRAVHDLSLAVEAGEILGFLGPNGAGKTTTVRTLMGFLRPTAGSCHVLGAWPGNDVGVRRRIGYLPGDVRVDPGMRASQLFAWFAGLRGVSTERADELSERLGLDPSRPFGTLSKGNRQKVGLVQAFLHDPEVIVLDEPSTGLDPVVQRELLAMIRESAARGAAVLFSSHVLPEVERIADRVAVLRTGRLVALAPVRDLLDRARHRSGAQLRRPGLQRIGLRNVPGVVDLLADGRRLDVSVDGPVGPALAAAARLGTLLRVAPAGDELEDLFFTEDDAMIPIVVHAVRRRRLGLLGWSLGLVGVVALVAVSYPAVRGNAELDQTFAQLSPAVRSLLGLTGDTGLTSPAGYLDSQFFANLLPVLLLVFGIGCGAWAIAGDEDGRHPRAAAGQPGQSRRGRARSVRRAHDHARRAGRGDIGRAAVGPGPGRADPGERASALRGRRVERGTGLAYAAIAFTVGAAGARRGVAIAAASGVAVVGFVLEGLGEAVTSLRPLRAAMPWHWLLGTDPLRNGLSWQSLGLPLALSVALAAAGTVRFIHRDLR